MNYIVKTIIIALSIMFISCSDNVVNIENDTPQKMAMLEPINDTRVRVIIDTLESYSDTIIVDIPKERIIINTIQLELPFDANNIIWIKDPYSVGFHLDFGSNGYLDSMYINSSTQKIGWWTPFDFVENDFSDYKQQFYIYSLTQ